MHNAVNEIMKTIIKKVFSACGLEIHRSRTLRLDMSAVLKHVFDLGLRPQTVIDVGVACGTFELYGAFPESAHLLIEPIEEFEPTIKDICRKFNSQYVLAAASEKPG